MLLGQMSDYDPRPYLLRRARSAYNDVNDWLTVGGDLDLAAGLTGKDYSETISALFDHGVTHVLDARIECDDAEVWVEHGLPIQNYRRAPIHDSRDHVPDEQWFRIVEDFVEKFWRDYSEGDRLYVHCQMGVNRGPSAAMLALLYTYPSMDPWEAFRLVRDARPAAGVVYAKYVGIRHIILGDGGWDGDKTNDTYKKVVGFTESLQTYWTPEQIREARGELDQLATS